jgi:hypothetical protein
MKGFVKAGQVMILLGFSFNENVRLRLCIVEVKTGWPRKRLNAFT